MRPPSLTTLINRVLSIDNATAAGAFFAEEVANARQEAAARPDLVEAARAFSDADPETIVRCNIGFCFGEGMSKERRAMWREVCGASHPWFGDMVEDISPEEARQLMRLAIERQQRRGMAS